MANNATPFEVLAGLSIQFYTHDPDEAEPSLDDDATDLATAGWNKVGLSGDLSYDNGAGVSLDFAQDINFWKSLGDTGSRKAFRTSEDFKMKVKVVDLRLETLSVALNGNAVTTVAASAGHMGTKKIGLSRGLSVKVYGLLVRLMASPYGEDWYGQIYVPRAVMAGSPTVQFMKGDPAGLELEWAAMIKPDAADVTERFGLIRFGHEDAA